MKTEPNDPITGMQATDYVGVTPGLTKREYFAALAMQGLQASNIQNLHQETMNTETVAKLAVKQADKLIEELNKERL